MPKLHAKAHGMAPLRASDERVDHRVGRSLYQRAEREGDGKADRDDDDVAPQRYQPC